MLFLTPFIVISTNSWFSIWINIELNLIIFIGLILLNNYNIYNSPIKYYLINTLRSSLFIILININLFYINNLIFLVINLIIIVKLGIFPFQFWFIDILINLNWVNCLILVTWQKFIPFIILIFKFNVILLLVDIFLRGILSVLFGFNQINLKKIIGYSSINHICWILFSLIISELLWLIYYLSYIIINISLIYLFKIINLISLLDLFRISNKFYNLILIIILFSLGRLPPFFGFLIKWYRIFKILLSINFLINFILIYYSLMYLYNYIRLCYSIMIMNYFINKINYKILVNFYLKKNLKIINLFILFSLTNLFLIFFWMFY